MIGATDPKTGKESACQSITPDASSVRGDAPMGSRGVYMPGKSARIRRRSVPLVSAADVIARWTRSGGRAGVRTYVPDGDESRSDDSGSRRPECAPYKQEGACPPHPWPPDVPL